MIIFFAVRFAFIFLLFLLLSLYGYGYENITRNIGGVLFSCSFFSAVLFLFNLTFLCSIFTFRKFELRYNLVVTADNIFLYTAVLFVIWFFLKDSGAPVSVGGHQGELVLNGFKTKLGWDEAARNIGNFVCLLLVFHAFCSVQSRMTFGRNN